MDAWNLFFDLAGGEGQVLRRTVTPEQFEELIQLIHVQNPFYNGPIGSMPQDHMFTFILKKIGENRIEPDRTILFRELPIFAVSEAGKTYPNDKPMVLIQIGPDLVVMLFDYP